MSFNHRVVQFREYVAIHEVYYDENGGINGVTEEPSRLIANDADDLALTIERLKSALDKPILQAEEIGLDPER